MSSTPDRLGEGCGRVHRFAEQPPDVLSRRRVPAAFYFAEGEQWRQRSRSIRLHLLQFWPLDVWRHFRLLVVFADGGQPHSWDLPSGNKEQESADRRACEQGWVQLRLWATRAIPFDSDRILLDFDSILTFLFSKADCNIAGHLIVNQSIFIQRKSSRYKFDVQRSESKSAAL